MSKPRTRANHWGYSEARMSRAVKFTPALWYKWLADRQPEPESDHAKQIEHLANGIQEFRKALENK